VQRTPKSADREQVAVWRAGARIELSHRFGLTALDDARAAAEVAVVEMIGADEEELDIGSNVRRLNCGQNFRAQEGQAQSGDRFVIGLTG
jgi:hypothetical protein